MASFFIFIFIFIFFVDDDWETGARILWTGTVRAPIDMEEAF